MQLKTIVHFQESGWLLKLMRMLTPNPGAAGGRCHYSISKTTKLAMKLTAFILLAVFMQVAAKGFSQSVSISVKEERLDKVFSEIKKQTGYSFFYTDDQLKNAKPVTVKLSDASLDQVLEAIFHDQPFSYQVIEKMIVIKAKEKLPNADATSVIAPTLIDISGKVTDAEGNPLAGASVKIKGTKNGTTTGNDGSFTLKAVDENATLEISYVGYQTYSRKLSNVGGGLGTIALKINAEKLGEIIINKGYYTEKAKTSVSSVVKVNAADIEKQPVNNVLLALQARVPGLFVTQYSGIAGSNVNVRVQGQNSIINGSDPLYVVDGVPIDAQMAETGVDGPLAGYAAGRPYARGNPLSYLNPSDIESVEVLKDADATSLFGSRAANGAILITTKKGKAGDMRLNLNMQSGIGKMVRRMDMMNTRQYLDMRYEAFANDHIDWRSPSVSAVDLKLWDTTRYTNWQDELLGGTAHYNDFNASVSGGSTNMRYLVSGTYHKETTIFPLPKDFADQKASVHFNLNATNSNQKLRMQFSGNYMFDDNELPQSDFTQTALLLEPDAPPLLNADGSINWAPDANGNSSLATVSVGTAANPLTQKYLKYTNKTHNLLSSLKLDYTILPGLNIGSSFGYNYMQTNDFSPNPLIAVPPELRAASQRIATFGDRNIQSWIIEPQASYRTKISRGTLDVLVGSTFQDKKAVANSITGTGQLSDELLDNINAAAVVSNGRNPSQSQYRYNALFSRVSYNWSDKYILSVNARRDGSSRFGSGTSFHNFGSVGGAWIFSSEHFFKPFAGIISFGKFRGNYGTTGNDQIGDFQFLSLYQLMSGVPYQGVVGVQPTGLPNPYLEWEETRKLQVGIDLNFFSDRIITSTNFVRNRSSNQLLHYHLPSAAGYDNYLTNFPATVENRNWEIILTGKIVQKKDFSWTSTINLTLPQNKLIAFPGLDTSAYANMLVVGQPVDVGKFYDWVGVSSGTGDNLYADRNGHVTLTPGLDDRTIFLSKSPKLYGGFDNSITYKNLQLDFIFQFVKQNGFDDAAIWNNNRYPGMFRSGNSNQPVTVLDRWQKPGDVNKSVAKYSNTELTYYILESDRRVTDASYISLKNVSLSWSLPQKWVSRAHFKNLRVYMHAQNLLTLSHYKGLNPETQSLRALPPLQVWTAGLQLGL